MRIGLAYDLKDELECLPRTSVDDLGLPVRDAPLACEPCCQWSTLGLQLVLH